MSHDIFISYSSKDKVVADTVVATMETNGMRCWVAPRDIKPGADWAESITKAIDNCTIVLLIFSTNSNQSKRVRDEIFYSIAEEKTLIPFRIENLDPTGAMRLHLSSLHWLDAYQPSWQVHLDKLVGIAADNLERSIPTPVIEEKPPAFMDRKPQKKTRKAPLTWVGLSIALLAIMSVTFLWWLSGMEKEEPQSAELNQMSRTPEATQAHTQTQTTTPTMEIANGTKISPIDGMAMVNIPAGEFEMGSESGEIFEKPIHIVYLDEYWIDQIEVTNGMYAKCVEAQGCTQLDRHESYSRTSYFDSSEFKDYPVIYVSWSQAKAYCEWAGRRLPTEAEWEKAARGTNANKYPWGDSRAIDNQVNFCDTNCPYDWKDTGLDDGYADTAPAGNYRTGVSLYGALDMAGNVWEWTSSLFKDYPYDAQDGRENLQTPGERVIRGGSWRNYVSDMRSTLRYGTEPSSGYLDVGFRCVLSP